MSAAESRHLTPTEGQMLQVLARNPGKLVSQHQLLQPCVRAELPRRDPFPCAST